MSAVHIQPVFSVPMGFARFEHPDLLNPHLKSLFLRREAEGRRNVEPSMRVTHALFESRFDLFAWPDREILTLRDFCFTALYQLIAQLNRYTQEEIDKIKIASDSWFHITRKGGYFGFHNHPMASWSGVYCVDSGGIDPASTDDNGALQFINPNQLAGMFLDAGNRRIANPYGMGNQAFKLEAGQLVLFPSWLNHQVLPYQGDGERITVAFNTWFAGLDRW